MLHSLLNHFDCALLNFVAFFCDYIINVLKGPLWGVTLQVEFTVDVGTSATNLGFNVFCFFNILDEIRHGVDGAVNFILKDLINHTNKRRSFFCRSYTYWLCLNRILDLNNCGNWRLKISFIRFPDLIWGLSLGLLRLKY